MVRRITSSSLTSLLFLAVILTRECTSVKVKGNQTDDELQSLSLIDAMNSVKVMGNRADDELQSLNLIDATNVSMIDDKYMKQALHYKLLNHKPNTKVKTTILKGGCSVITNEDTVTVSEKENNWRYNNRDITLTLAISMQGLKNRELWNVVSDKLATLSFCVRTELVRKGQSLADKSVSLVETNFFITFDLLAVDSNKLILNKVTLDDIKQAEGVGLLKTKHAVAPKMNHFSTVYTDFNKDVTSCLCDDNYSCNKDLSVSKNSNVQICIMSPTFKKLAVNDLSFSQNGIVKFQPIKDGSIASHGEFITKVVHGSRNSASTSDNEKEKKPHAITVLRARIHPSFYEVNNPSPILIQGLAKLSLKNKNIRHLQDEEKGARFVMMMGLAPIGNKDANSLESALFPLFLFIGCAILLVVTLNVCTCIINKNKNSRDEEFANFDETNKMKATELTNSKSQQRRCTMSDVTLMYDDDYLDTSSEFTFDSYETGISQSSGFGIRKSTSASNLAEHVAQQEAPEEEKNPSFITELQLI